MIQPRLQKARVGVLICRFQVPELTEGHLELVKFVQGRHDKIIILLGRTPGVLVTSRNPLDYWTRRVMLREAFPDIEVLPLKDMPSDTAWSLGVDAQIKSIIENETVMIYGSRDSFIPHYSGRYQTTELDEHKDYSGTKARKAVSDQVRASEDFRRGAIYAAFNMHKRLFMCVDIAVINTKGKVYLGRKANSEKWQFPGGFIDMEDSSIERAAAREAREELGNPELSKMKYVGSAQIDDYRYKTEPEAALMTAFFTCTYCWGEVKGSDDLEEAKAFTLEEARGVIVPNHIVLLDMLETHLEKETNKHESTTDA